MRQLRYREAARRNLADMTEYIAAQSGSPKVARAFVAKLRDHCRKLAGLPGTLGTARAELGPDIRSTLFRGYVIFFRYSKDGLEIVSVLEGHRDIGAHFESLTGSTEH